jgi:hypothetical protein
LKSPIKIAAGITQAKYDNRNSIEIPALPLKIIPQKTSKNVVKCIARVWI